ncbi:hypothetical protein BD413DRAFT_121256 [Trametes elegans]|nr:hypothetical protein BD413DRAFT_121256 [Trametes elegans]
MTIGYWMYQASKQCGDESSRCSPADDSGESAKCGTASVPPGLCELQCHDYAVLAKPPLPVRAEPHQRVHQTIWRKGEELNLDRGTKRTRRTVRIYEAADVLIVPQTLLARSEQFVTACIILSFVLNGRITGRCPQDGDGLQISVDWRNLR